MKPCRYHHCCKRTTTAVLQ